jgi:ribosomal protein L24
MDIKPVEKTTEIKEALSAAPTTTANSASITPKATSKFKAGMVQQASSKLMLPPAIQGKLSAISKAYDLPFDLSAISLQSATPDNIKALRNITELLTANSKLLPELMKLTAKLLKSDIKLAEFHVNLTKAAVKHQTKLDKATADIWLGMAGYGAKASKLEHRTNVRDALIQKRTEAYEGYYQNSVYGEQSKIIDVEYEIAASNQQILAESKQKKMESSKKRKQKLQEYIDSAFTE